MGLNWGISYKNDKMTEKMSLISFSGWNTSTITYALEWCGSLAGIKKEDGKYYLTNKDGKEYENNGTVYKLDWNKMSGVVQKLKSIDKIFANCSDRQIDQEDFPEEVYNKYNDLCYDLNIDCNTYNIRTLQRLNHLFSILEFGDLLDDYMNPGAELFLESSC